MTGKERSGGRARGTASVLLVIVAALLLLAGAVAHYARTEILDQDAFADRAVEALDDDRVRKVVRREIVVNLIDRGSTDLVAARPLLESVVDAVMQSAPFRALFRRAAVETNRLFFTRERRNALFDISDAAELVRFALRSVSPKLAKELPEDFEADLLTLRRRDFAGQTLAVADDVRVLGVVLPLLALLAFAAAILVAPDRRIAVLRSGVAVGVVGALLAVVLLILRARILAGLEGEDELTDADVQAAGAGLLDAFVGPLIAGGLLLALGGLVVGAAAAALDPEDVEAPLTRLRRQLGTTPRSKWRRALRGVGALVLGVLVVLNPTLAVQVAAIAAGAVLVFFGTSELLVMLQRGGAERRRALPALARSGAGGLRRRGCGLRWGARRGRVGPHQRKRRRGSGVGRGRALGHLQRIGGALRAAPQRGRLRRYAQLVLRRRQPGLVHLQPAPHDPAPAARRDSALPDRSALGRGGRTRPRADGLRRRGP